MFLRTKRPAPPATEIRPLALADGREVPVRWVRDRRARRLRLIVSDKGARLTLPTAASVRMADAFLHEHRDWLGAQLDRQHPDDAPLFGRDWSEPLPLRGAHAPLAWREGRFARALLTEHGIELQLPERADDRRARAALRDFYLQQARTDLGTWLPRYLPALPRPPSALRLRPLSSLWGSLSPGDAVSLDLALVMLASRGSGTSPGKPSGRGRSSPLVAL